MGLKTALDVLSDVIEQYESSGTTVQRVDARTGERDGSTELHATIDVPVALCAASSGDLNPELSPQTATLTDSGGLQVEFPSPVLSTLSPAAAVSTKNEAVRVTDNNAILLTVEVTIDATDATADRENGATTAADDDGGAVLVSDSSGDELIASTDQPAVDSDENAESDTDLTSELEPIRNENLPPYEDTEYLQQLYDSCDTFTEMSQKIEMDVASETVRRYMIEASIHDPTSYNTATEEEVEENPMETIPDEQLVADGIGLPEGIQIEDVADAVVDSMTVFEVQRHLGLEQQRARDLLEQLNLLELVMRRIAGNPEREVTYEEVATRICQCAPNGA